MTWMLKRQPHPNLQGRQLRGRQLLRVFKIVDEVQLIQGHNIDLRRVFWLILLDLNDLKQPVTVSTWLMSDSKIRLF